MLSEELKSIQATLGRLLNRVDPECANTIRQCRRNLEAAAEQAEIMESNYYPKEAA